MNCFVWLPVMITMILSIPHLSVNYSIDDDISNRKDLVNSGNSTISDSAPARTSLEDSPSEVNSTYALQSSINASVERTNRGVTLNTPFSQNNSSLFENSKVVTTTITAKAMPENSSVSSFSFTMSLTPISSDINITSYTLSTLESEIQQVTSPENASSVQIKANKSISRTALLPNSKKAETGSSSAFYALQIIIIVLSAVAVVLISAYLTKELAGKRLSAKIVRDRFFPRNRRSTIGKRYSDISLQMMNNEAGLLDLPEEFVGDTNRSVVGKAEVVTCLVHQSDSSEQPIPRGQEKCSPKSSEGEWL